MVRTGSLPMRRIALEYGSDIVYSPEYIDRAVMKCERQWNKKLEIAQYSDPQGKMVFAIDTELESDRLLFQIGTANVDWAVEAAEKVVKDVAGIDINCGCPKHFSTHGGMGAGLLRTPDKLVEIMTALVENVTHGREGKPVSCKIRIVPATEAGVSDMDADYWEHRFGDTVKLVTRLQDTGIAALGIHARLPTERYETRAHQEVFRRVKEALDIPVIANGDIMSQPDIERVLEEYQVDSVMLARAAQYNASVFRRSGEMDTPDAVARKYLLESLKVDNAY